MTFRVGQKVCCIKEGKWLSAEPWEITPVKGTIYTVRAVFVFGDDVVLLFDEIVNELVGEYEPMWWDQQFRPVRTTDISIFKAMLAPTPKQRVSA